jgi:alpha-L-fucosidase
LYLLVKGNLGGEIVLRGLKNKINRIYVVGDGTKLKHKVVGKVFWSAYPGLKYIEVPDYVLDDRMTVIAVMRDGKVNLYREACAVIESN